MTKRMLDFMETNQRGI